AIRPVVHSSVWVNRSQAGGMRCLWIRAHWSGSTPCSVGLPRLGGRPGRRSVGVAGTVADAAQRAQTRLGGVPARLAGEGDSVEPSDLALALHARGVSLREAADQLADALAQL